MRATCPVPRGVRRDRRGGESPGEDVARSVSVRVIRVATFDAAEEGLALAVLPCDMTADAALLRSETRIGIDHLRPGRCGKGEELTRAVIAGHEHSHNVLLCRMTIETGGTQARRPPQPGTMMRAASLAM